MTMLCVCATKLAQSVRLSQADVRTTVPVVAHKRTAIGPFYQPVNTTIMAFVLVMS